MSEYEGIEAPPPSPPYQPGDRIFDRVAANGASYKVLACYPIPATLAGATRASWQVIFELPTGHRHYVWADDDGYTPRTMFGPTPYTLAEVFDQLDTARAAQRDAALTYAEVVPRHR